MFWLWIFHLKKILNTLTLKWNTYYTVQLWNKIYIIITKLVYNSSNAFKAFEKLYLSGWVYFISLTSMYKLIEFPNADN